MQSLVSYFEFGLDSLAIGAANGALDTRKATWWRTSALLGLCDGLATSCANGSRYSLPLYAGLLVALGVYAVLRPRAWRTCALPVLLSVDNLLAPHALDGATAGLTSAVLALSGFFLAELLLRFVPSSRRAVAMYALAVLALALFAFS